MGEHSDIIIIGAGIAGASLAARLVPGFKVTVLEAEDFPGYHSTGRSAALYATCYGSPAIIALTAASGPFLQQPPNDFCEGDILSPRAMMTIGWPGDEAHLEKEQTSGKVKISLADARKLVPHLQDGLLPYAMIDEHSKDIDVDLLHRGFLRQFKAGGGTLHCNAAVTALARNSELWTVTAGGAEFSAPVIVNAAGAWADTLAGMAGLKAFGIQPKRRSAALISVPDDWDISRWPLTDGAGETFYFKPMGGKLMVSPADATPVEAHDAWADDMELARAMELLHKALGYEVTHVEHTWGGLRSFPSDNNPVVGFDPRARGFFWLAGQGGYGIQTSPALSELAASLITGNVLPENLTRHGVDLHMLAPDRFL